jgi:hypothetical protein
MSGDMINPIFGPNDLLDLHRGILANRGDDDQAGMCAT